jgi:hypothetical protein
LDRDHIQGEAAGVHQRQHLDFPVGLDFLKLNQDIADKAGQQADGFIAGAGTRLPKSAEALGSVLSLMYRAACCSWGCDQGDHVMEWMTGRVVNQAVSAHRLVRAASYDEALMLIRGIGESANLLWLFLHDRPQLDRWRSATRRQRLNEYGPAAVRAKLETLVGTIIPIDRARYQALCEVGTHPVPGLRPGHFTGTGRPVLGGILQEVGVFVCMTELGYAVSMCSVPLSSLLELPGDVRDDLRTQGRSLLLNLGSFTILNYDELLEKARASANAGVQSEGI